VTVRLKDNATCHKLFDLVKKYHDITSWQCDVTMMWHTINMIQLKF